MILRAVRGRCDHPSADDICDDIKKQDGRISRATVYRNLGVLCESGEIARVTVPAADRFDLRCDRHYHFFCTCCGRVFDAPAGYLEELDRWVEANSGFSVSRHRTVFEGICPECSAKKAAGAD